MMTALTPLLLLAGLGGLVWAASAGATSTRKGSGSSRGRVAPPPGPESELPIDNLVIGEMGPLPFRQDPMSGNSFYYVLTAYPVGLLDVENPVRFVVTDEASIPLVTSDNGASFLSDVSGEPVYFDQLTGEVIVENARESDYVRSHYLNLPTEPPFGDGVNMPIVWWRTTRSSSPIDTSGSRYTRIK